MKDASPDKTQDAPGRCGCAPVFVLALALLGGVVGWQLGELLGLILGVIVGAVATPLLIALVAWTILGFNKVFRRKS